MGYKDLGILLVFEGVNGSGKSTLSAIVNECLQSMNVDTLLTNQPGKSSIGEWVRATALNRDFNRDAASMLIQADRLLHVEEVIKPALEAGKVVICDRYIYSTCAYQIAGQDWDIDFVEEFNKITVRGIYPDRVFLIDVPAEVGLLRDKKTSRYYDEHVLLAKTRKIRQHYLDMYHTKKHQDSYRVKWHKLSGELPLLDLTLNIMDLLAFDYSPLINSIDYSIVYQIVSKYAKV